jgi:hypothetical protein
MQLFVVNKGICSPIQLWRLIGKIIFVSNLSWCVRKSFFPNSTYSRSTWLERRRRTTKNVSHNTPCPHRYGNTWRIEYKPCCLAWRNRLLFRISGDSIRKCMDSPSSSTVVYECEIHFWNVLYFTRSVTSHDDPHQEIWGWHKTRQETVNTSWQTSTSCLQGRQQPAYQGVVSLTCLAHFTPSSRGS